MKDEKTKKTVTLRFLRAELLNDLEGYGYVEGDVQRADADHLVHGKHETQDIGQDGNVELVTRHLDLALSWCREELFPYTKRAVEDGTALDDELRESEEYIIELEVPSDFSESTVTYLEQLIHNLLVYYTLWHWLLITKPEGAAKWLDQAESLAASCRRSLSRRCGRTRRPLQPF